MRLKNKKILSLLLVGLLSSSVLVGCNKKEDTNNSTNTNVTQNNTTEENKEETDKENKEEETTTNEESVITLYIPDVDNDELKTREIEIDKQFDEYALLSLLKENSITINKDAKVNKFTKEEKDGEVILSLDLSKEIYPQNVGSSEEVLMLDALSKSYLNAFNAQKIKITVDGDVYESGHICLEPDYEIVATTNFRLLSR